MIVVSLFYDPFNNQPYKVAILLLTNTFRGARKYKLWGTKVYFVNLSISYSLEPLTTL